MLFTSSKQVQTISSKHVNIKLKFLHNFYYSKNNYIGVFIAHQLLKKASNIC